MAVSKLQERWARRAGSIAAIVCLISGLAAVAASAAPKIDVPTTRKDIGELIAGDTAEVEFPLANVGTDVLKIDQVIVSCGCTTTSYPPELKPGEKGVLKAKLTSNAMWNGQVEKRITVMSNDPE